MNPEQLQIKTTQDIFPPHLELYSNITTPTTDKGVEEEGVIYTVGRIIN